MHMNEAKGTNSEISPLPTTDGTLSSLLIFLSLYSSLCVTPSLQTDHPMTPPASFFKGVLRKTQKSTALCNTIAVQIQSLRFRRWCLYGDPVFVYTTNVYGSAAYINFYTSMLCPYK